MAWQSVEVTAYNGNDQYTVWDGKNSYLCNISELVDKGMWRWDDELTQNAEEATPRRFTKYDMIDLLTNPVNPKSLIGSAVTAYGSSIRLDNICYLLDRYVDK